MSGTRQPVEQPTSKVRQRVVVVGAGIGGLVAAALLARAGVEVLVLEAQAYVGGCAGTFFRQRYRFDAGATVASGFAAGGPMLALADSLGVEFDATLAAEVMRVHMPRRAPIALPSDRSTWRTQRRALFGDEAEPFWAWQERTAATAWSFADHLPPWPARSASEWRRCFDSALAVVAARPSTITRPSIVLDAGRPLAVQLPRGHRDLRDFVDGLLQISAQATSEHALALYGAAALDFPWRGVAHLRGGLGGMSETLVEAIHRHGGRVLLRRRVERIVRDDGGRVTAVEAETGERFEVDHVIANATPWNIRALLDPTEAPLPDALVGLRSPELDLERAWGAFVIHCGIRSSVVDPDAPLHHNVQLGGPLGEGNSAFISISPSWDESRAPVGKRAVTITTHTKLEPWWTLRAGDPAAYAFHKANYQDRLLAAAELAVPGFRRALDVVYAGTPITYAFYTGRARGWVGGIPQTRSTGNFAADLGPGLSMVGDCVFPGQSTLAVALSSWRVATALLDRMGLEAPVLAT